MDNQQETLKWYVAGLFEGEGSILIAKVNVYGKQLSYRGLIQFTNTEPEICQKYIDFLKSKNWSYHVRVDVRKNKHKVCYQIEITKKKDKIAFLNEMCQIFVGKKRKEGYLVLKLLHKIDELKETMPRINTRGQYEKTPERFEEYEKIYREYKEIKDSPETTCEAPTFVG